MPQSARLFVGTITGTSVDGLDLALLQLDQGIRLLASSTATFPGDLRATLLELGQPGQDDLDRIGAADAVLGEFIGRAILDFLAAEGTDPGAICAIGSHGQTIRHRPEGAHPFTWQIGDPNRIAELTGITTVADIRRRDMAAGGQGAPLVPAFHEALFRVTDESRVLVNIGGISNLSWLPADPALPVGGFDTGPGNGMLDAWCEMHRGTPYDENGNWARTGEVVDQLLDALFAEPYLKRPPPKSTGREAFNLPWLADRSPGNYPPQDVQRTLLEFTARTILEAQQHWAHPAGRLIICGGGRSNGLLMERLCSLSAAPVQTSDALGFDGDAMEAAAFAWLAARRLDGEPGNAAAVTGAAGPRVLGAVYPGRSAAGEGV